MLFSKKKTEVEEVDLNDVFVWTEAVNCGEILKPMLMSFLAHHNRKIYVFGLQNDLRDLETHSQTIPIALDTKDAEVFFSREDLRLIISSYSKGHMGTAALWSRIILSREESFMIHLDADTIFVGDVVNPILAALRSGFSIAGPRRNYRHHQGNLGIWRKVVYRYHRDSVHTYAFGFNRKLISISSDRLENLINGEGYNQIHSQLFPILDFFDRITFHLTRKKPAYYFSTPNSDGRNEFGSSNEIEENVISFFAVGSGCAFYKGKSVSASKEYMEIAQRSFATFSKYLLDDPVDITPLELPKLEEKLRRLDKRKWILQETS